MEVVKKQVKRASKQARRHKGKIFVIAGLVLIGVTVYRSAVAANPAAPELISVNAAGKAGNGPSGQGDWWAVQASSTGRYVGFLSDASDLGGQRPGARAVYVRDVQLGTTVLASVDSAGVQEDGRVTRFRMSGDGRKVAFYTVNATNMEAGSSLFWRDLDAGQTVPVPRVGSTQDFSIDADGGRMATSAGVWDSAAQAYVGACGGTEPEISRDGTKVVRSEFNLHNQVYICDVASNVSQLVSSAPDGSLGNGTSNRGVPSADGNVVTFLSNATNLISGANGLRVYSKNLATGAIQLADVANDGTTPPEEGVACQVGWPLSVSADGTKVAFASCAKLTSAKTGGIDQVYVRDTAAGTTVLASTINGKAENDQPASVASLDDAGDMVGFGSRATNLGSHLPFQVYLKHLQ